MATLKIDFPKEWTFESGTEYPVNTNESGAPTTRAFYFGKLSGKHVFYAKHVEFPAGTPEEVLRRYVCESTKISWMSDAGDDEPAWPVVELWWDYQTTLTPNEEALVKKLFTQYELRRDAAKEFEKLPHYDHDLEGTLASIPQL